MGDEGMGPDIQSMSNEQFNQQRNPEGVVPERNLSPDDQFEQEKNKRELGLIKVLEGGGRDEYIAAEDALWMATFGNTDVKAVFEALSPRPSTGRQTQKFSEISERDQYILGEAQKKVGEFIQQYQIPTNPKWLNLADMAAKNFTPIEVMELISDRRKATLSDLYEKHGRNQG